MKKLLLLLLSMASLSGITQQASPLFSIAISTEHSSISLGDPVHIRIELTNLSKHDIDCAGVASNGLDRSYQYKVKDFLGNVLSKKPLVHPEIGETFSPWPCVVKPGASAQAAGGLISAIYSFKEPGQYTIVVSRYVGGSSKSEVSSNPLTITVIP